MKNLVTGGAGFIGSHVVDRLMNCGEKVICLDNLCTGSLENIKTWIDNPNFQLINHDVINPIELNVDRIWHLACPASPLHYQENPIKTAKTSFLGTYNMLGMARRTKARLLFASTSEVYGDPEIHPQPETYNGSVNPTQIRSCYTEGKRIAESLCFDYLREHKLEIRVARIFNTYGPRMLPNDGRVISNFISQAIAKRPHTIYGDGLQTRSFCYVDDLVDALIRLMLSNCSGPINLGNPQECTILELSRIISKKINATYDFITFSLPKDDPMRRKPDINLAKRELDWEPLINLDQGLNLTIDYFKGEL
ncbi:MULTISPECIES: UDP-glucuronic acid decarboxylase family protein [Prochlorococcus]|uniref:NAD dependent epimerase/dehydratase n=1 Tax=Prochlorococcus marinus (strain SARG / CCMP1375 / SS120) TaxID=167539 RepID=Q7VAZ0_PROMA|nr:MULTISPECIES: UDP-glucuronic acid decarboxylase family protein [Prochlorococcus]AAQ00357.1 NAD dependent epimerase/dehydratase [Prochlorococcus marinus subsp. marinus str. CCMP1375]KGG14237.1 NAD dependent epimerase/dehydratase [Prochlorococcus marinus str. LG]KGG22191.1 NAD dependent epimerase/dehydratase [Prochlorococcus marinus str. SS2]KGG24492.1 NAD dependent epimerase/dehydratase [Prochlorococcus marinus str. SS35]KGG33387.1 NAD dependent epimerase/dehydratase [Prochlorococcus marinus